MELSRSHCNLSKQHNEISVYLYNRQVMVVGWVGGHLLLGDLGPYGIAFMTTCLLL